MNLFEAFKALDALNEDTFSVSDEGIKKLDHFQQEDEETDAIDVIDTEAETEDDLQDSYVGKVILDCGVCHSKIYKDKEEVELNDDQTLANVGEDCPFCYTSDGFKVIGEVSDYSVNTEQPEDDNDVDTDKVNDGADDTIEESLSVSLTKDDITDDKSESLTDTLAEAVATLERPMSAMGGTLSNVMIAHKDELSTIFDREGAIAFLDNIEPEVKNKGYLNTVRTKLERVPNNRISQFLYNIILKGDGMGTKMESIKEAYTDVDGVMGEKGAKYTEDDLKAYWDKEKDNDPVLANYKGDYQKWLSDTTKGMKQESLTNKMSKPVTESVNNVNVETDDSVVNVSSDENGKVTVTTEPITETDTASEGGDVLAPVDAETQDTIMNGTSEEDSIPAEDTAEEPVDGEEAPAEGEEVDAEVDEFVEESFNHLCGSYLREVYDNVESFETSEVKENDKGLVVEGLIRFDSGNTKKTSFILEAKDCTRSGHCRFVGSNKHLSESADPYLITGKISEGKLICESLSYNYTVDSEEYTGIVRRG